MSEYGFDVKAVFLPLQDAAFGDITGSYVLFYTLPAPVRIIKFTNSLDQNVLVSFDGSTDHVLVASASFTLFDLTTNKGNSQPGIYLRKGTPIYIKYAGETPPTEGEFWIEMVIGE